MRGAAGPAHKHMRSAVVLILTKDDEGLSSQGMERIPDGDFCRRNQGIMSPLPSRGERAAAMYSLTETAKLNARSPGLPGQVLARIAGHPVNRIHDLLPWNLTAVRARLDQRDAA